MKRVSHTEESPERIAQEWDRIAEVRHRQIRSGLDDSMTNVLAPTVAGMIHGVSTSSLIDIGCGTGWLTTTLAPLTSRITGVDMSKRSIDIAMRESAASNVEYVCDKFECFSRNHPQGFDVAVANMTLVTVINLGSLIDAVANVLKDGGHFVLTIAHPCYWPLYWGYADCQWFNYSDEVLIEAPFKIGAETTSFVTTHVHRPIEQYVNTLCHSGLVIEKLVELTGKNFRPPRFLAIKCRKMRC